MLQSNAQVIANDCVFNIIRDFPITRPLLSSSLIRLSAAAERQAKEEPDTQGNNYPAATRIAPAS